LNNKIIGELRFNSGWEKKDKVIYCGKVYDIDVNFVAYFETDQVTLEQENSYKEFLSNKKELESRVEEEIARGEIIDSFYPVLLLVKRNGDYGLVFDRKDREDDGMVVVLKPKLEIVDTDVFF